MKNKTFDALKYATFGSILIMLVLWYLVLLVHLDFYWISVSWSILTVVMMIFFFPEYENRNKLFFVTYHDKDFYVDIKWYTHKTRREPRLFLVDINDDATSIEITSFDLDYVVEDRHIIIKSDFTLLGALVRANVVMSVQDFPVINDEVFIKARLTNVAYQRIKHTPYVTYS